jgi:hypothetical protein
MEKGRKRATSRENRDGRDYAVAAANSRLDGRKRMVAMEPAARIEARQNEAEEGEDEEAEDQQVKK